MEIERFLRTVPRQRRSTTRVVEILAAVGEVLDAGGVQALSMTSVSAASGVPIPSLYDYFTDTNSMVGAFIGWEHHANLVAVAQIIGHDLAADQITAKLVEALDFFVEHMRTRPGFRQADAICDSDVVLHAYRLELVQQYADLLQAAVHPHIPDELLEKAGPRSLVGIYLVTSICRLALAVEPAQARTLLDTYVEMVLDPLPVR